MPGPLRSSVPCSQPGIFPATTEGSCCSIGAERRSASELCQKRTLLPLTSARCSSGLSTAFTVKFVVMLTEKWLRAVASAQMCHTPAEQSSSSQTVFFFFLGVIIFALNHPLEILLVRRLEMGSTLTCFCQIVVEFLLNNSLHLKDHCSDNHLFIGAVTPYLAFSSLK